MTNEPNAIVKAPCSNCGGGPRNHQVIAEHTVNWADDEAGLYGTQKDQICQCQGCESVRFRHVESSVEECDENGEWVETVSIYPDSKPKKHRLESELLGLGSVGRIYRETVAAFNADANILAGGGLRAIVEAVCKDKKIKGDNLRQTIDALVTEGMLAKPQAALLHEERYIGNSALHELQPTSDNDLVTGLEIVETLLKTIYILPKKAEQLRQARSNGNSQ